MESNNKRIAKNTLFLYFRMILVLLISLYTSRVVLEQLGITNFGIYNVVGGLAIMFTFFSSSLANATQRFLSVEIGKYNKEGVKLVLNQHLIIYCCIILGVVILAETVGLWFVYNKLSIPQERLCAAIWVYQLTVVSLCVSLFGIVFNSLLIAHENMKMFSYIGIFESLGKLSIVICLGFSVFDKMIFYALLLLLVNILTQGFYFFYCRLKYSECRFQFTWDKQMFKQTFSFLGWNTFGTAAHAINDQGINILLNIFFGPTVNAARAVSFQVSANISNLVSNFFVSLRPQVVKSYVNEEHNYLKQIFIKSSKYSFFFLWLLCLPFIMNVNTILAIWLKKVPEDAPLFTIWVLIFALINNFTNPVWTIIIATGSLKKFMLIGNGIFLLVFPIGFLVLKMGYPPVSVFIVLCVIRFLFLIAVLKILQDHIEYSFIEYFKTVILPVVLVAAVTFFIAFQLKSLFSNSALSVLLYGFIIGISVFFITFLVGLNTTERLFVQNFIKRKLGVKFIGQLN